MLVSQPHVWSEPLADDAERLTEERLAAGPQAPHGRHVALYLVVAVLLLIAGIVLVIV